MTFEGFDGSLSYLTNSSSFKHQTTVGSTIDGAGDNRKVLQGPEVAGRSLNQSDGSSFFSHWFGLLWRRGIHSDARQEAMVLIKIKFGAGKVSKIG